MVLNFFCLTYFTYMVFSRSKSNKWTNKRNKQTKLIDTDDSIFTRGKWGGGVVKGKGGQICTEEEELTLGGGHTMQYTDNVSQN